MTDSKPRRPRKTKPAASPRPAASSPAPVTGSESAATGTGIPSHVETVATSPGSGGPGEALFPAPEVAPSLPEGAVPEDAIPEGAVLISIRARVDGYRRGGIAHHTQQTDHLLDTFTEDQLKAILADADLSVEFA